MGFHDPAPKHCVASIISRETLSWLPRYGAMGPRLIFRLPSLRCKCNISCSWTLFCALNTNMSQCNQLVSALFPSNIFKYRARTHKSNGGHRRSSNVLSKRSPAAPSAAFGASPQSQWARVNCWYYVITECSLFLGRLRTRRSRNLYRVPKYNNAKNVAHSPSINTHKRSRTKNKRGWAAGSAVCMGIA